MGEFLRSGSCACFVLILGVLVIAGPRGIHAATSDDEASQPISLRADSVEFERARDIYVASGNVVIEQTGRVLNASWVMFSGKTRRGVASGDVTLTEGRDQLRAEFLEFEMDRAEGVAFIGLLDSATQQLRLEGQEIQKTGENTYQFRDGIFTSCRCPKEEAREPWRIRARKADLEVGGYGTAKNTTVDILEVPALWFPWMIYPLKTERQSGFLMPELGGSSRTGTSLGLPFFWAMRHNVNLTLTPRYLADRGLKGEGDLEYVFGEKSEGSLYGAYIDDQGEIFDDESFTEYGPQRWATRWEHDQYLPDQWRFNADVNRVSDNDYAFDFGDVSMGESSGRALDSKVYAERVVGKHKRMGFIAGAVISDDMQAPDDRDRDDFMQQRLTDINIGNLSQRIPGPLSMFLGSFDLRYTMLSGLEDRRDDYAGTIVGPDLFADVGIDANPNTVVDGTGNGQFDEGEPVLDQGHRVKFTPRIALPLRVADVIEFYGEAGYNQSFYDSRAQGFAQHGFATGRMDMRMRLRKPFDLPFSGEKAAHVFVPRIGWAAISPDIDESDPLFTPRGTLLQARIRRQDLRNVTLDPSDRVDRYHGIVMVLENEFFKEQGTNRMLAEFDLSLDYRFDAASFGRLSFDGHFMPIPQFETGLEIDYDIEDASVEEALLAFSYRWLQGSSLRAGYRFRKNLPQVYEDYDTESGRFDGFEDSFQRISQIDLKARGKLTEQWAFTYRDSYSFELEDKIVRAAGLEYRSRCKCWKVGFEFADHRTGGGSWKFTYSLIGLGREQGAAQSYFQ